jgi:hypothetical protein
MANINELKDFRNGSVRKVLITRPVEVMGKLIKKNPELAEIQIIKITDTVARIGVNYEHMKGYTKPECVSEEKARTNTGHYIEGERNRVLETSTGKVVVCLKKGPNPHYRGHVTWILNGKEVSYSEVEPYLYAKDKYKENKEELLGYMVSLDNITILPRRKEMK